MVDRLNPGLLRIALAVAFAGASGCAAAQGLADPTRPPGATAMQGTQDEPPPGRQLQSVLFSAGRKVAIIDGRMVSVGEMFGESRVVKIGETEVVLKTGSETETLKLYPGVDKQPVKRASRSARAGAPSPLGGTK